MNFPKEYDNLREVQLTRYLYIYDETVYSFITQLLLRKNIENCYYLMSEIYETDPEKMFPLLWKIYFDFYAEFYPSLETCLSNKHRIWKENNSIRPVLFVVKNMFRLKASSTVFHLRQFVENGGKCLCLYRLQEKKLLKRDWVKYPKLLCRLFVALERGHIQNAGCYIYKLLETLTSEELYFHFIEYFGKFVHLKNSSVIKKKWDKRMWCNDKHMLLAFVVGMNTSAENIISKLIFKQPCEEEYMFVEKISCVDSILPYRVLQKKRRHVIVPEIGAFQLAQEKLNNCFMTIRDNWEYYAIRSDIWKQRFQKFGGYVEGNTVVFMTQENEDKFYTYFGYELDEQALWVQKSGCVVDNKSKLSWSDWHKAIFDVKPRIILGDNFRYNW